MATSNQRPDVEASLVQILEEANRAVQAHAPAQLQTATFCASFTPDAGVRVDIVSPEDVPGGVAGEPHVGDVRPRSPLGTKHPLDTFPSTSLDRTYSALPPGAPCPVPKLNILIMVVGTRGDVQPFVALGNKLVADYGHRVRIASHAVYREYVAENGRGLEFYPLGGNPEFLSEYMTRNGGMMASSRKDVTESRKMIGEIIHSTWDACVLPDPGPLGNKPRSRKATPRKGAASNDAGNKDRSGTQGASGESAGLSKAAWPAEPFVADAIIANPPSYGHIHCAEKLGIPLHMYFTMPWSPTKMYPHPLARMQNLRVNDVRNRMSYAIVDELMWAGLVDIINGFRKRLGLEPIPLLGIVQGSFVHKCRLPFCYIWSPSLAPAPSDWGPHIDVVGFFFLDDTKPYVPPPDLAQFLGNGDPPIYLGFGSLVVPSPDKLTQVLYAAVRKTGVRALVSKGWGGLGEGPDKPDSVFVLGNVPHGWLFPQCSAVIHHGGAGTTAAGLRAGKPTTVVPFFGDQPFWGLMVHNQGAGPAPLLPKDFTEDNLVAAIEYMKREDVKQAAQRIAQKMAKENGLEEGCQVFHRHLPLGRMVCRVCRQRLARMTVRRHHLRICFVCYEVLSKEGLISRSARARECYVPIHYDPASSLANEEQPLAAVQGLVTGTARLLHETVEGLMGIVVAPAKGYHSHGVPGIPLALTKALAHALVAPLKGTAHLLKNVGAGLDNTVARCKPPPPACDALASSTKGALTHIGSGDAPTAPDEAAFVAAPLTESPTGGQIPLERVYKTGTETTADEGAAVPTHQPSPQQQQPMSQNQPALQPTAGSASASVGFVSKSQGGQEDVHGKASGSAGSADGSQSDPNKGVTSRLSGDNGKASGAVGSANGCGAPGCGSQVAQPVPAQSGRSCECVLQDTKSTRPVDRRAATIVVPHVGTGLLVGTKALLKGVRDGVKAVPCSTRAGYHQNGASGAAKGFAIGLVGLATKPIGGIFYFVGSVAEGVLNTPRAMQRAVMGQQDPLKKLRAHERQQAAALAQRPEIKQQVLEGYRLIMGEKVGLSACNWCEHVAAKCFAFYVCYC
eukprot:jgi/Mesvir1/15381/Mv06575-RA.9